MVFRRKSDQPALTIRFGADFLAIVSDRAQNIGEGLEAQLMKVDNESKKFFLSYQLQVVKLRIFRMLIVCQFI